MNSGPLLPHSRFSGKPVALVVVAAALAACGTQPAPAPVAPEPRPAAGGAVTAQARADSLRRPYTHADIRFMSRMIHHHGQAVLLAGWAPSHGAGPEVRRLAERIVNAQQDEIASMRQWLLDRGQPVHPAEHGMHMPGMLTREELQEVDQARGEAFDRLFLVYMIQHHRGAVSMVRDLFGTAGAAQDETVFKLANDVSADQSAEIARMEAMLATHIIESNTR